MEYISTDALPAISKYYDFFLFLFIGTSSEEIGTNSPAIYNLFECYDEFESQIIATNPFLKDGYYLKEIPSPVNNFPTDTLPTILSHSWIDCFFIESHNLEKSLSKILLSTTPLIPGELLVLFQSLQNTTKNQKYSDGFYYYSILNNFAINGSMKISDYTSTIIGATDFKKSLKDTVDILMWFQNNTNQTPLTKEIDFFNNRSNAPKRGSIFEESSYSN